MRTTQQGRDWAARNVAACEYIDKFAKRRERIGGTVDVSTKDLMLDTFLEGWAACARYYSQQYTQHPFSQE